MRVVVCGGRDYSNREFLHEWMTRFHEEHRLSELVHGAARGADTLASEWAKSVSGIVIRPYPVEEKAWRIRGDLAPLDRNWMMLSTRPDYVIAFPGGSGTGHMVTIAIRSSVPVVFPEGDCAVVQEELDL